MEYLTDDGLEVKNFDVSHGYKVGDSIDGLTLEIVIDLPKEHATVMFMKMDADDVDAKYQYVLAYGPTLAMSNASFDSLNDAIDAYNEERERLETDCS